MSSVTVPQIKSGSGYTFEVTTPPAVSAASSIGIETIKDRIGIHHSQDDNIVTAALSAAANYAEAFTGCFLFTQSLTMRMHGDFIDAGGLELRPRPVQSVTAFNYWELNDSVSATAYTAFAVTGNITADVVNRSGGISNCILIPYTQFPTSRRVMGIDIEVVVGFGTLRSHVPAALIGAIEEIAAYFYDNPGIMTAIERSPENRFTVRALPAPSMSVLSTFKRFRL